MRVGVGKSLNTDDQQHSRHKKMSFHGRRAIAEIAGVLVFAFVLAYWENGSPIVHRFSGYVAYFIAEAPLLLVFVLALRHAGLLRGVQARSRIAAAELIGILLVITLFATKVGLSCPQFCISVGGGWTTSFPTFAQPAAFGWVGAWLAVALTEELGFRGYILRGVLVTLKRRRRGGIIAVLTSSAVFTLFHLALLGAGSNAVTSDFLLQAFIAGVLFGLTYWLTGWNLVLGVVMHFLYDGVGGGLYAIPFDSLAAYRVIFVFIFLPSCIAIVTHWVWERNKGGRGVGVALPGP